jgi:hypothetical protein
MPDITMCRGEGCHKKHRCYRHTAFPNEYQQSYFVVPPYQTDGCPYFWQMEEHDYADRTGHRDKPSTR